MTVPLLSLCVTNFVTKKPKVDKFQRKVSCTIIIIGFNYHK